MLGNELNLQKIYIAKRTITPFVIKTPVVHSIKLSNLLQKHVMLKLENLQEVGSFKIRGATNKIFNLHSDERKKGVIAASTGNHGIAVSYVSNQLGVHAVICVSEDVPHNRIKKIQYYGGEVIIHGKSQDDAFAKLQQLQQKCGYTLIHPFDDIDVIAGQGTIGIELIEDVPQLEMVLVPLSGGGLISGIAAAVKAYNPNIKVFGVSQERSPVMYKSIQRGYPIEMEEEETLADSLRGGIGLQNRYTFKLVNKLVDDIILVNEAEIAMGMHFLFTEHNMVIEGAGAVGISALLSNKVKMDCKNIAVIISGNTIETEDFLKAVKHHL